MDKARRIAIVGAGISGLSLSIALRQLGFTGIKVFQKDVSFDARRQGYGLTILQAKSALKKIGVLEQAKKHNAPSKAHYIFDTDGCLLGFYGTLFWDHKNNNRSKRSVEKGLSMHIPRQSLRKVLLNRHEGLTGRNSISWNHSLASIQFGQQSAQLYFSNKQQFEADIVFGCDGINSLVRKAAEVREEPLNYLGVMVVLGLCKAEHGLNKNRVFQTADGQFRLFSMPFLPKHPNMGSMWQLSFKADLATANHYTSNLPKLKGFLCQKLKSWHQPIPQMIESTEIENLMSIPAFDRDPVWPQLKDNRAILLGDALHPMSPFKGQGANQALIDAVQIADIISSNSSSEKLSEAIQKQISGRAFKKVQQSRQRVSQYHDTNFTSVDNFLYPGIDKQLINILKRSNITAACGQEIEIRILSVMKQQGYL